MTAQIEEIRPRRVTQDNAVRVYHVWDAPDEDDLVDAINSLPDTVAGFPYSSFEAEEIEGCENSDEYTLSVTWGRTDSQPPSLAAGTSGYRFNFQAPSGHIKRALATIAEYEDSALLPFGPPPMYGAINVVNLGTPDMKVEGLDLQPPPEVFAIPYNDVPDVITPAYLATVRALCGKVNSTTFYGAAAGEIMLVRADGERKGGLWNLEFGFGYIPNAVDLPVGDNITVSFKDGMDYVWALDTTQRDDTTKSLVIQPSAAYVVRVWERADLTALNLPS